MNEIAPPDAVLRRRRFRGPFRRWPRTADAGLAAVMFVLSVAFTDGPGDSVGVRGVSDVPWWALVVFAVAAGALYWRRRAPLAVLGIGLACWALLLPSAYADLGGEVIVGLYSVGRHTDRDWWGEAAAATASLFIVIDALVHQLPRTDIVVGVVVMCGAWYVGRSRRLRAERAAQFLREQEAEARRIVAEERTRIARELHDVVAHRVSLMTVQASAADAVLDADPAAAHLALRAVEEAGRQALDELRHLLGVLRPGAETGDRDPQPGLADLRALVDRVRAAGADAVLHLHADPGAVPARIGLSTHRIVQEALTNVLRHAGDGAGVEVRVRTVRDALEVVVIDDGGDRRQQPDRGPGTGHGLVGMRERTLLLGGRLDAGPVPGGGFRVVARLPLGRADGPWAVPSRSTGEEART